MLRLDPIVPLVLVGLPMGAFMGCAAHEPVDSAHLLRQQYAQRLSVPVQDDPAQDDLVQVDFQVPFELTPEIRQFLETDLPRPFREADQADEIVHLIFRVLDLQYEVHPTYDAAQTFQHRSGNCLSFVNLFVGIARERGLNASYVEVEDLRSWSYREGTVVSQGHIVAGLYVDGDLRLFDFLPDPPSAYRRFQVIDDLRAAAHYYNNLAAEALLAGNPQQAVGLGRKAMRLAPDFPKAINNLGVALVRIGETSEAMALYRRGLEIAPDDEALLGNLAAALDRQGQTEEAQEILERVSELRESNPWIFLYRAELALGREAPGEALNFLAEALRRESELPEVHLGLVKTYLALGELDRARHHLERLIQLDPGSREAQRYASLLQGSRMP